MLATIQSVGDMKTLLGVVWLTAVRADFLGDLVTKHHNVRKALVINTEN